VTTAIAVQLRVADAMVTRPTMHGPDTSLKTIRTFFEDEHVHMALIVTGDGRLVTTIERPDLAVAASDSASASGLGTLAGRTAAPSDLLATATATLVQQGRRRLAVVDGSGRLIGLLCLKRAAAGYCSDEGIRERAADRARCHDHARELAMVPPDRGSAIRIWDDAGNGT
jgi:CBS-domain-containing membrane protein